MVIYLQIQVHWHVFIFFQPAQKANTFSIKSGLGFGTIVVNFYTRRYWHYTCSMPWYQRSLYYAESMWYSGIGNVNIFDCGVITTKLHIAKSGNEGLTKVIPSS